MKNPLAKVLGVVQSSLMASIIDPSSLLVDVGLFMSLSLSLVLCFTPFFDPGLDSDQFALHGDCGLDIANEISDVRNYEYNLLQNWNIKLNTGR